VGEDVGVCGLLDGMLLDSAIGAEGDTVGDEVVTGLPVTGAAEVGPAITMGAAEVGSVVTTDVGAMVTTGEEEEGAAVVGLLVLGAVVTGAEVVWLVGTAVGSEVIGAIGAVGTVGLMLGDEDGILEEGIEDGVWVEGIEDGVWVEGDVVTGH
jgi:hypothetical protein